MKLEYPEIDLGHSKDFFKCSKYSLLAIFLYHRVKMIDFCCSNSTTDFESKEFNSNNWKIS